MKYIREVKEAVKLGRNANVEEMIFCKNMADAYGCKPLSSDKDNFNAFLSTIYHYGKIQGVRQERAKKRANVICSNIEKEKLRLGISDEEFAKILGIVPKTYYNWLNGVNPIPSGALIKMARLFNVKVDYLLEPGERKSVK